MSTVQAEEEGSGLRAWVSGPAGLLDRPLTSSLLPTAPTAKTVTLSPDARLVDQTTNPYLFSLMGSSFNDRGYLVLDPYSPAADAKLQKRLKDQQKQAAAAAASAATGTTSSGG